jgi:hypothetical protein
MKKLIFLALTLLTMACSPSRHSTTPSGTQQTASGSTQDGSSYANAVVIKEKSETVGVSAEYKWIGEHYPGYKTKMQALQNVKGKPYDVLTIETADGVEKKLYFDISNFFGKF